MNAEPKQEDQRDPIDSLNVVIRASEAGICTLLEMIDEARRVVVKLVRARDRAQELVYDLRRAEIAKEKAKERGPCEEPAPGPCGCVQGKPSEQGPGGRAQGDCRRIGFVP